MSETVEKKLPRKNAVRVSNSCDTITSTFPGSRPALREASKRRAGHAASRAACSLLFMSVLWLAHHSDHRFVAPPKSSGR